MDEFFIQDPGPVDFEDNIEIINLAAAKYVKLENGNIKKDGITKPPNTISQLGKQLLVAAETGDIEDMKALMKKGAPFSTNMIGMTPLHMAAQNNHLEACQILLRAGTSRDAKSRVDKTPLHLAVAEGNLEIVKCLLSHRADVDIRDMLQMTPLHWAVQNSHVEIARLLLDHGAQLNVINKYRLSPLDIANQVGSQDMLVLLQSAVIDSRPLTVNITCNGDDGNIDYPQVQIPETGEADPYVDNLLEEINSEDSIPPEHFYETVDEMLNKDSNIESTPPIPEIVVDDKQKYNENYKLLEEHGIFMVPPDDPNILSTIIDSGLSISLNDVGKQVFNSTRPAVTATNVPVNNNNTNYPVLKTTRVIKKIKLSSITNAPINNQILKQIDSNNKIIINNNNKKFIISKQKAGQRVIIRKSPKNQALNFVEQKIPSKIVGKTITLPIKGNSVDINVLTQRLIRMEALVDKYKKGCCFHKAEAEKYKNLYYQTKNRS